MIEAHDLTKRYGSTLAVDHATFRVENGSVTGFLGPNGAGKSTAMRMIVGLDRPTSGTVLVDGKPFEEHSQPMHTLGALLDAKGIHPGRSARNHLRQLAAANNISKKRVNDVLEMTGLTSVAKKRAKGFSLGMGQRLGIAAALLGDPRTLVLDEPVNGLDPEGVRWVRELVRRLAREGRSIFISSHLMSEMAQTADHIIVIGRGRIITQGSTDELIDATQGVARTRVRSPRLEELISALRIDPQAIAPEGPSLAVISGITPEEVGDCAAQHGIAVHELSAVRNSLEDAFMAITAGSGQFQFQNPNMPTGGMR